MPVPALFPRDDQPVVIQQGKVGSCYLLAGLDCILNKMDGGRALVKQQFTQDDDGGVYVKIRRNEHSRHLNQQILGAKYVLDQRNKEFDYWYIPKEQVERIERENVGDPASGRNGVAGNCLAVKILERLSSYYYITGGGIDIGASLIAHNKIGERFKGSPTGFLGDLLGVHVDNLLGAHTEERTSQNIDRNIEQIIKLFEVNPNAPVYIDMRWGESVAGLYHEGHALRVDKIVADGKGDYIFSLVNPWDTDAEPKLYTLAQLKERIPWFSHFSSSSKHSELTAGILKCPTEIGKYIYKTPAVFKTLLELVRKFPEIGTHSKNIELIAKLHKENPQVLSVIDKLLADPTQSAAMISCINDSKGEDKVFMELFIKLLVNQPDPKLLVTIPIENSGPMLIALARMAKAQNKAGINEVKNTQFLTKLSSAQLLKIIVQGVMIKKTNLLGGDSLRAKNEIGQELINYYWSGDINQLKDVHVHEFFKRAIFTSNMINQILTPPVFLSKTVTFYIRNSENAPAKVTEYIKKITPKELDADFVNDFFSKEHCKNPKVLFDNLQKINALNPEVGKHLALIARTKIDKFYPGAFDTFNENAEARDNLLFKNCFPEYSAADRRLHGAIDVIKKHVGRINDFPVQYPAGASDEAILNQCKILLDQLKALSTDDTFKAAKNTLGLKTNPPEIEEAIKNKVKMIGDEAKALQKQNAAQKAVQDEARSILEKYFNKIKDFQVDLEDTSAEKLAIQGIDLRNILKQEEYIKAKKDLGLVTDPPNIIKEFRAKADLIDINVDIKLKANLVKNIEQEAALIIDKHGPKGIMWALEAFKVKYHDPFEDGLLSDEDKMKVFEKHTPEIRAFIDHLGLETPSLGLTQLTHTLPELYKNKLESFQAEFDRATTPDKINNQRIVLHEKLHKILNEASKDIGFELNRIPPGINAAYMKAMSRIEQAASAQNEKIHLVGIQRDLKAQFKELQKSVEEAVKQTDIEEYAKHIGKIG
jgi:hypothetical protein